MYLTFRTWFLVHLCLFLVLSPLGSAPVSSQGEVTPEPTSEVTEGLPDQTGDIILVPQDQSPEEISPIEDNLPALDINVIGQVLLRFVSTTLLGGVIASPFVVGIVGVLKRFKFITDRISVSGLSFTIGATVYLVLLLAAAAGYEIQVRNFFDTITTLLPAVTGLVSTIIGSGVVYQLSKRAGAPIVGETMAEIQQQRDDRAMG